MSDNGDNAAAAAGRRRSSAASERFAALHAAKRDNGNERSSAARASFSDQKPKPGFLGQMWDNFTRGSVGSGAAAASESK